MLGRELPVGAAANVAANMAASKRLRPKVRWQTDGPGTAAQTALVEKKEIP